MKRFPLIAALGIVFLSACDPIHGVETRLILQGAVDVACLDKALRTTSNVGAVEFRETQDEGFEVAPNWGHVTRVTKYWSYSKTSTNFFAILQLHESEEGSQLENGLTRLGVRIPDDQVNAYVPLMHRVNARIEDLCGVPLSSTGAVMRY